MKPIRNTEIYINIMETLKCLNDNLSQEISPEKIEIFKDLVFQLKSQINEINMDLNRPMSEKLELYTLIFPPLNQLTNRFQIKYKSISDHSLYRFNFIELKILEYFILWSSVNNSSNQFQFYHQISANLLAKILELESFDFLYEPVVLTNTKSLDKFGQQFNFHQISAGLYASGLTYLDRIHITDAKNWISKAFQHYKFLFEILTGIDYPNLYNICKEDENREFFQLLEIFIWPILDYVRLIHTVYQYFGEDWEEVVRQSQVHIPYTKLSEHLQQVLSYYDNIKSKVLTIPALSKGIFDHPSWYNYESIQMILKGKLTQIEKILANDKREDNQITEEFIRNQLQYISKIITLMENNSQTTILSYHTFLATENLIKILLLYHTESGFAIIPYLDIISNFITSDSRTNIDQGLVLLYFIAKFNHLQEQDDQLGIQQLYQEANHFLTKITAETADSLLLRITLQLVKFGRIEEKMEDLESNLKQIQVNYIPKSIHFHQEFTSYIEYLIKMINHQKVNYTIPNIVVNRWDWRTWLFPDLSQCKRPFKYHPINHKYLIIDHSEREVIEASD